MIENVLEKIIKNKSEKIVNLKKTISQDSLNELINTNRKFINFKEKIENNIKEGKFSIIAEIKKASPSAGVIIKDYDPVKIAKIYNDNKTTCLSVLTEEDYFLGNLTHISKIKHPIIKSVNHKADTYCWLRSPYQGIFLYFPFNILSVIWIRFNKFFFRIVSS